MPSPRGAARTLLTGHGDGVAAWVRDLAREGDDGWFGPSSTVWAVHADAATLVGGIRALLMQAMHPVVLAGFDDHSDYRADPESRLQRTAAFVAITTFGTTSQADAACARVRRAHAPVRGSTPSGQRYDAADPELSGWVHLALVDSLAESVRRFGRTPFDFDSYLRETARVGERLGAAHVPHSVDELVGARAHYMQSLSVTLATRQAHSFLLNPPLPARIRLPYRLLASVAAASLPPDLRRLLGARPLLPDPASRLLGRPATALLSRVLGPSLAAAAAARRASRGR
jgi:uncharacterized protein (DUF2236 family)